MRAIHSYLVFLTFGLFLLGCKEDDSSSISPLPPEEEQPSVDIRSIEWAEGFPLISTSYKSVNIQTKITGAGKVYYVLSETPLENTSGEEIKRLALLEENDPKDSFIGGVFDFTAGNLKDTASLTLN